MRKYFILLALAFILFCMYIFLYLPKKDNQPSAEITDDFESQIYEPWRKADGVKDVYKDFNSPEALIYPKFKTDTLYIAQSITIRGDKNPAPLIQKLKNYKNLEGLNFSRVDLTQEDLENLFSILSEKKYFKKLIISFSNISTIPVSILSLENLETLAINHNKISTFPDVILKLRKLKYLRLDSNLGITELPSEIGKLFNLDYLDFKGCPITTIPSSIEKCTKLKTLLANDCQIDLIPKELGNCKELETLNLGENKITSVPKEIGNLTKLGNLDLGTNLLTSLPNEISNLKNLWIFILYENQLTEIPMACMQLPNLENLLINKNDIEDVPIDLSSLSKVLTLTITKTPKNEKALEEFENSNSNIKLEVLY